MIHHIVLFKLHEEALGQSRAENLQQMAQRLQALPALIPQIVDFRCGVDVVKSPASYDFGLYSAFASLEELKLYADHPAHLKVKDFILQVSSDRAVVDFET